ncbi:MAG: T9SS type A sorting domain-containing protein [Bacteroidetes bacterium]|nr:T9SS type A sorting domain-containing protein [Bacteroidota bacterium]
MLGLQLNKNAGIKVAFYYQDSIGYIQNPNNYGTACNYQTFPLTFNGRICKEQFPNFNTNYFNPNAYICGNGIAENGNLEIKFFPNPVEGELMLTNLKGKYNQLAIFNVDGKHVLFKQISYLNEIKLDVENLSSGIYFIQLKENKFSKTKSIKFIKINNFK